MNPLTQSKNRIIRPVLIALTVACFALSAQAQATCQDGCFTNNNTVLGDDALTLNTTGINNTAIGASALSSNTEGYYNTANGVDALFANTTGADNTATGVDALQANTFGFSNTATGAFALMSNTTGIDNTATGADALDSNTTGFYNTASGARALFSNTTGRFNTAEGQSALGSNTTGNKNIAIGTNAGFNLTTGNNNIDIFDQGVAGEADTIRIGRVGTQTATFIAGISGATVPTGVAVIVDSNGHLGTTTSSARFKEAIQPMDKASEAIFVLKPVTFRYKHELDPKGVPQFGLVAEDVEKVNPDLVARDADGKAYTVRYEAVNAMLLNEFLKEHRTVDEQGATMRRQRKDFEAAIAQQQKEIEALIATVKEQSAQIQRVSAQLEVSKAAPQTVSNNH